jgi:hypothetical protein
MTKKDILLFTPPFTQLNTPYPATAYLKGFLDTKGYSSFHADLGIEVILDLFSKKGLQEVFAFAEENETIETENAYRIFANRKNYLNTIDKVILFLQGKNSALARKINSRYYLPEAKRFSQLDDLEWAFGTMGIQDKAKHLSTMYLEDISDFIVEFVDPNFGFSRYAEKLSNSANSFDELNEQLAHPETFIDRLTLSRLEKYIEQHSPTCIGFSVPFPGNLYSALRCGKYIKQTHPNIQVFMGGGFPNTELRELRDKRIFEYIDFILLDDGERPIENLLEFCKGNTSIEQAIFKRTYCLINGELKYVDNDPQKDYSFAEVGTPNYQDLHIDNYLSIVEMANPMHSLWSDGYWNKLTMAHGCYWKKCTFCDISLDYIQIYEPITAKLLVDRMEEIIQQTGKTGFHFVDEAAPPSLMKNLALEIIKRELDVTWWTNIRFEKSFTNDLCALLQRSGCIAVSGGIEVASNRLLKLINKGITVEQVSNVTNHFTRNGIMVHAYLMYGYPTQSIQETIDSLEMVRQFFEMGIIQSGFWHRFALTAHSPIGFEPEKYGIELIDQSVEFAKNEIPYSEKNAPNHGMFQQGLRKAVYNFMHDVGFDFPLQDWFEFEIPETTITPNFVENSILQNTDQYKIKLNAQILSVAQIEIVNSFEKKKKKRVFQISELSILTSQQLEYLTLDTPWAEWLIEEIEKNQHSEKRSLRNWKESFEESFGTDFESFWNSKPMLEIRSLALLVV